MLDNLKKYWFVILIGALFVVFIGAYSVQSLSSIFRGKSADGKSVIMEVADTNIFTDDIYNTYYEKYGQQQLYSLFERSVLSAVEATDEIKKQAEDDAKLYLQNASANAGTAGVQQLDSALVSLGYQGVDELHVYLEDVAKRDMLLGNYLSEHYDTTAKAFVEANKPRIVSHILIKMEDPDNPTDAEKEKMAKVEADLDAGISFAEVAATYSDDEGSAPDGGKIGYVDANSTDLVEPFVKGALTVEQGQHTGWITSISSNYSGKHMIYVDSTEFADIVKEEKFIEAYNKANPKTIYTIIWEQAQKLDVNFTDEKAQHDLLDFMGIEVTE